MNEENQYIKKAKQIIAERDALLAEKRKIISDSEEFAQLSPEVDKIVSDLEKQYQETMSAEDKEKLEEWKREQDLYLETVLLNMVDLMVVNEKLEDREDLVEAYESLYQTFLKRKEILDQIQSIKEQAKSMNRDLLVAVLDERGIYCDIPEAQEKEYGDYIQQFYDLDRELNNLMTFIKDQEELEEEVMEVQEENLVSPIPNKPREELEKEYQEILSKIHDIENGRGRKFHFKTTYEGVKYEKDIPRNQRGNYSILLNKLHKIEKQLKQLDEDELVVYFDESLYQSMTEDQQRAYLANLQLQIENLPNRFVVAYINGKDIPVEYADLYKKILSMLKPKKAVQYYSRPLENVRDRSLQEQFDYYQSVIQSILDRDLVQPTTLEMNHVTYKINEEDVTLFQSCFEHLNHVKLEMQKQVADLHQAGQNILGKAQNNEDNMIVSHNNSSVTIPKNEVVSYLKIEAMKKAYEECLQEAIVFDEEKFAQLKLQDQVNYCKDLLNQIIMHEAKTPVDLFIDNQKVTIDSRYLDAFNKAAEKLLGFREKSLDIKIDEDYVSRLTDEEKKSYYLLMMHDITEKPIEHEAESMFDNRSYKYDVKYKDLFHEVRNRYLAILAKEKEPVKVTKFRPARFVDKIKKELKKKSVQIGLVLGLMASSFGLGRMMSKNVTNEVPVETVIETVSDSQIQQQIDDSIAEAFEKHQDASQKQIDASIQSAFEKYQPGNIPTEQQSDILEMNEKDLSVLGETFVLNSGAQIFDNTLSNPQVPKYQNDVYTTTSVVLQTKDNALLTVDYRDPQAKEIVESLLNDGAIIVGRGAVANHGFEDYLQNGNYTGFFRESDLSTLNIQSDLQDMIVNSLQSGRSL